MKTIDINAKEWFDKVNGNSYFSAVVTVDFCMDTHEEFLLPFQYGYGDHYIDIALLRLQNQGLIPAAEKVLWQYCRDNNIILRTSKQEHCLKRELDK